MTQKEIDKLLANTKVYVARKSKEIQEKLFSLGYCWHVGGSTEVKHENEPFLFIYKIHSISCTNDMCTFMRSEYREISAEEILALELDKHNYRPFKDKNECLTEMMKHKPFSLVKYYDIFIRILSIDDYGVEYLYKKEPVNLDYSESLKYLKFIDGTPFGIKKE